MRGYQWSRQCMWVRWLLAYLSGTTRKVPTRSVFRDQCHCYLICAHYVFHMGEGGYVGYVRKALEKGYLEHPGSAWVCMLHPGSDGMLEIFVLFGNCLCCMLPDFVYRQSPCPCPNFRHVLLHPQMYRRSLWFAKELAPGVKGGCGLVACPPPAPQKGLVQADHSNLHATTRNTRFYLLLRPLLLQHSFGIRSLTRPRPPSMNFWQPASAWMWTKM